MIRGAGPLIVRGGLIFRRVTDDWLSLRPCFFWWAQMVRGAPTALTCFFVGLRADFVTTVRVSVALGVILAFGSRGPENPTLDRESPALDCRCRSFLFSFVFAHEFGSIPKK